MSIPVNIIANADDFGLNSTVNKAICFCFERGYNNSTSLLTNTPLFEETVNLIHLHPYVHTIGVHVNLAEDKPISDFKFYSFLDEQGYWNFRKVNKKYAFFSQSLKQAFFKEIAAQIEKALAQRINITHLDSHYHLHTHPCFYPLFMQAAKQYRLKLRIAQTYNEGSSLKFLYRHYINCRIKQNRLHFSDFFENVNCLHKKKLPNNKITEIMLHPTFNNMGELSDHYDYKAIESWMGYLNKFPKS